MPTLTGMTLQNVKPFGPVQSFPVRPLTLIFGENSAGKSSIFQSLLLLQQSLISTPPDKTGLTFRGDLDLGSFRTFVHRHDLARKISIGLTLEQPFPTANQFSGIPLSPSLQLFNAGCVFSFAWNGRESLLSECELRGGLLGKPLATFVPARSSDSQLQVYRLQADMEEGMSYLSDYGARVVRPRLPFYDTVLRCHHVNTNTIPLRAFFSEQLLPSLQDHLLALDTQMERVGTPRLPGELKLYHGPLQELPPLKRAALFKQLRSHLSNYTFDMFTADLNRLHRRYAGVTVRHFCPIYNVPWRPGPVERTTAGVRDAILVNILEEADLSLYMALLGPQIEELLTTLIHLGPQRESPERYYIVPGVSPLTVGRRGELAQYHLLADPSLERTVNRWLTRLKIPYRIHVAKSQEGSPEEVYFLSLRDRTTNVQSSLPDVGFGLSQLLPIVVQSLIAEGQTLLIEEPEIHLHPALQAELADLFIASALGNRANTIMIETHSEHLILRLLRRIRESHLGKGPRQLPKVHPSQVAVLYVQSTPQGGVVTELPITPDGDFEKPWPKGFFEERLAEVTPDFNEHSRTL